MLDDIEEKRSGENKTNSSVQQNTLFGARESQYESS